MNLFDLLLMTKDDVGDNGYRILNTNDKKYIPTEYDAHTNERTLIVPGAQDCLAVTSIIKNVTGAKDVDQVSEAFNSAIFYSPVNYIEKLRLTVFINNLIKATMNHWDFKPDFSMIKSKDRSYANTTPMSFFRFHHLVPLVSYSALTNMIVFDKYMDIFESVHALINNCLEKANISYDDFNNCMVDVKVISDEVMFIHLLKKYNPPYSTYSDIGLDAYNNIKDMEITKEHFDRYVKLVMLAITRPDDDRNNNECDF